MKFLLFFISLVFSFIFYIFHNLTIWQDIFWNSISNSANLVSLSWNLLIESFIFLIIWLFFLYNFSNSNLNTNKWENKLLNYKYEILYFIFYFIFFYFLYFYNFGGNYLLVISIIIFIISDILFNHISNIKKFNKNKINIRILWLILNYFSSIISIYYILYEQNYVLSILILLYNIVFNLLVHKNYTNYISLFISIWIIGFLFYMLYFFLFELYILYI
jgi:hypothetical protein